MPAILKSSKWVGRPIHRLLPKTVRNSAFLATPEGTPRKVLNFGPPFVVASIVSQSFNPITHVASCLKSDNLEGISNTELPQKTEEGNGIQELELQDRPSPVNVSSGSASEIDFDPSKISKDEALEPFLKFFKGGRDVEEGKEDEDEVSETTNDFSDGSMRHKKVRVQYYEPKPGDFVVGVVVSGNENKLDVNVGADMLGTMLTKEVLPLYLKEMDYLLCDLKRDAEDFMTPGSMGILGYDEAISGKALLGRPVVEVGTILFAEVLGRTLSGRPLLSTRRFFRRIAWHRVRQIKELNEPIRVRITEWNTGGLLTRIEGLRAFLPKTELLTRVNSFAELKENVGRDLHVLITRMEEAKNDLVLSQRQAWEKLYLREGTLIDGTVRKIYPFGAQVRMGESNISGLLHVSNISRKEVTSVEKVVAVDEKVKVLVVKSPFPNKISLSIADLESEPGLFLSNKEKVFSEADMMAKKYREKLPSAEDTPNSESEPLPVTALPFENEASMYANWTWFKFEKNVDQTYESLNGDKWELLSH